MEEMVTQGSAQTALTRIEESYFVGDVIIASSAVIGHGVVLRADPGCSITIRDGVCLGPGVIIHASQGAIELHQGVCLAGGVLIIGAGFLGRQVCVGSGSTLVNPELSDASMIGSDCLWGDTSRQVEPSLEEEPRPSSPEHENAHHSATSETVPSDVEQDEISRNNGKVSDTNEGPSLEVNSITTHTVIGKQQFELMLQKMFPDRDAFKRSQKNND